jgi:hypothetical protein
MLRVGELAVSPNVDPVACRIVEVSIAHLIKPNFMNWH